MGSMGLNSVGLHVFEKPKCMHIFVNMFPYNVYGVGGLVDNIKKKKV